MKYKHLIISFVSITALNVLIRCWQLFAFTDNNKGFFKSGSSVNGLISSAVMLFTLITYTVLSTSIRRCPLKAPDPKPLLGFGSLVMAIGLFCGGIVSLGASVDIRLKIAVAVMSVVCAVFFAVFSASCFFKKKFPVSFFIVPVVYYLLKLVTTFISISALSLTLENIILILSLCATLIFVLEVAKVENDIDKEHNYRKVFISGTLCASLSFLYSIPQTAVYLFASDARLHDGPFALVSEFATGIFAVTFIASYFSKYNLRKKRHHHHSHNHTKFMKTTDEKEYWSLGNS